MPLCCRGFVCAKENASEQEFRQQILQAFIEHKALDFMFDTVKHVALPGKEEEEREAHQL